MSGRCGGVVSEAVAMGSISIGIAVGLCAYWKIKEGRERRRRDAFFVARITENLRKMAQYFLDVESATVRGEDHAESASGMMRSLGSFYRRNEREMKDVLYQTKPYLPFWSELPPEDKRAVDGVLDLFSWLLYDYYQQALPEQPRRITVIDSREALFEKKACIMETADSLLRRYEAAPAE